MAQKTLSQILSDIGAYLDQDTTLPSGTELTTRVNLVNQSVQEWGNAYQWRQLRKKFTIPFTLSGASVALPGDYKKLMSPIYDVADVSHSRWIEIRPEDRYRQDNGTKWVAILGNEVSGNALLLSGMPSGASLVCDYQSFPSSLATLQDVCIVAHPEYVTKRTTALVLESRSDTRFPLVKAEADIMLQRMIEEEISPSIAENNKIPNWIADGNYIIGEF